jgi:hypothetical protein
MYARLRSANELPTRAPLDFWHFAVPRLREAFALLTADYQPVSELHAIGPNKGTKTQSDAAYIVACAQKRKVLDGIRLPQWRGPVECVQMVLDYPQQLLSVQPAYMKVLGEWPHHPRYQGATLKTLHIMPALGNPRDEREWSVVHFMSEESRKNRGTRALGVRADVVGFDEPPHIDTLRELRKAAHAGRRLILLLGYTPTVRSQWSPVIEDIGRSIGSADSRDRIVRIDRRRAAVRWNLSEVSDNVLSRAEKDDLLLSYLGPAMDFEHPLDPLAKARWYGDAIDTSGLCPFEIKALSQMLAECGKPEVREWKITREVEGENGLRKVTARAEVLVLFDARPGAHYYLNVDPSKGIEGGNHDPGGILVSEMGTGEDVAMYEGYLGTYGLGVLAAALARQYNGAVVDPENNGFAAEGVLRGLADSGYGNIAHELRPFSGGEFKKVLGFNTSPQSRTTKIEAVQEWVKAYAAGAPYARCRFPRIIETLMDTILDEKGRTSAAPGYHDEFLILKGQSLLKTRLRRPDPLLVRATLAAKRPEADLEPTLAQLLEQEERGGRMGVGGRAIPLKPKLRPIRR